MVINRAHVVLLSGFLAWGSCSAFAGDGQANQAEKPDYERGEKITKAITARVNSVDRATPFRTVETLVKVLGDGNLNAYLDCLTDESKKAAMGGKDLSPDQIQQLSEKAHGPGFQKSIIHSFSVNLDADPAQIELVISSMRGKTRIKERMSASLVETEDGWKLHQPTTDTLAREQVETDSAPTAK
jgi:hypothetical protein